MGEFGENRFTGGVGFQVERAQRREAGDFYHPKRWQLLWLQTHVEVAIADYFKEELAKRIPSRTDILFGAHRATIVC